MKTSTDKLKLQVAQAAIKYIQPKLTPDTIIGVGTGSTADLFISELIKIKDTFKAAVASSERTASQLAEGGIEVLPLETLQQRLAVYVDGADEINPLLQMIKGGGGALTQEKIVAAASAEFVCIADQSKWVESLGKFNIPVEVIASARSVVSAALMRLGARAVHERTGFLTDNGHPILDVEGFSLADAADLEKTVNQIPGVVTCGLFASQPASVLLLGTSDGVRTITADQDL